MKLELLHIKIHGFLSFGDAELDLADKGFCTITGINHDKADNAMSNGSGKSSLISAICWAITGETIQGLKSNIVNVNLNTGCFVELTFNLDNHLYKITRYKDDPTYKTDLKIIVDSEDKSGKGIRETQQLLSQMLPDLNSDIIGSVIILGQGLPHKLSNNTPSGRKELLEKLSKSDFMIEDIKNRLDKRFKVIKDTKAELNNLSIANTTKISTYKSQLQTLNSKLSEYSSDIDYDSLINDKQTLLKQYKESSINYLSQQELYNTQLQENKEALRLVSLQNNNDFINDFNINIQQPLLNKITQVKAKISSLKIELTKLKSITDICPTCGQKLKDVILPDTTQQEQELINYNKELIDLQTELSDKTSKYKADLEVLNNEHNKLVAEANNAYETTSSKLKDINSNLITLDANINQLTNDINILTINKNNHLNNLEQVNKEITNCTDTIKSLEDEQVTLQSKIDNIQLHFEVVADMINIVRRDFRGILLQHIIEYIDSKAKDYCSYVFGTNNIEFKLNGNNIDIIYNNKDFENLSGGEKQKIDIILQFALRDMMLKYLDFECNCLFLDEIFDNLDSIGCDNLIHLINDKLYNISSVFIISHRTGELNIPNDTEIIIEKDMKGISTIR